MANPDVFTLLSLPSSIAFTSGSSSSSDSREGFSRSIWSGGDDAGANVDQQSREAEDRTVRLRLDGPRARTRPESAYEQDIALVMRTIHILLNKGDTRPLGASPHQIQTSCQAAVVDARKGDTILQIYEEQLNWCCGHIFTDLNEKDLVGVAYLEPFIKACDWYEKQSTRLATLLAPFDGAYLKSSGKRDMKSLAYAAFDRHIFSTGTVVKRLQASILDWVSWEREHKQAHASRPLVCALVAHLQRHGLYGSLFEGFYLQTTHDVYFALGTKMQKEMNPQEFLMQCKACVTAEERRADDVLPAASATHVSLTAQRAFLVPHVGWVVTPALESLMPTESLEHLRGMYHVFGKIGCLPVLAAALRLYVRNFIHRIFTDNRDDEQRVAGVLTQQNSYLRILQNAFYDVLVTSLPSRSRNTSDKKPEGPRVVNAELALAVRDGIQCGLRSDPDRWARLLVLYIHRMLQRRPKLALGSEVTEEERQIAEQKGADYFRTLGEVLRLIRYTESRDVFRLYYQRALAKRLVLRKSELTHEDFVLDILIQEYDTEVGELFKKMIKDVRISDELTLEFQEKRLGHPSLSVLALQDKVWPFAQRRTDVVLPQWMRRELSRFEVFYCPKFRRGNIGDRKLTWDHTRGYATLTGTFSAGTKELSVDLLQAAVLLLFNNTSKLSFGDIASQTRIEPEQLQRTLQSLACGQKRVLRKVPAGGVVSTDDVFVFNAAFTDPAARVHINPAPRADTAAQIRAAEDDIAAARVHALNAAVMRVMKSHKRLKRAVLVEKAGDALPKLFPRPDATLVEESIKILLRDEYLKRTEEDEDMLCYNPA